jgi:hypothetical protein
MDGRSTGIDSKIRTGSNEPVESQLLICGPGKYWKGNKVPGEF